MSGEALEAAALDYLARYAASTGAVRRVLERRIRRRAADDEEAAQARATLETVLAKLVRQGFLDDRRYAAAKAESLARQGRSQRWIRARLAAEGVAPDLIRAALARLAEGVPQPDLAAAIAFARRRRLGPFRPESQRPAMETKDRAALARAGFDYRTTRTVLEAASPDALAAVLDAQAPAASAQR
ncbi:MAG: RecX family transcriptional regulator [Pseudomonadota bacterium]